MPVLKHLNLCKTNLFSVCRLLPWHCWACLWPRWTCLLNWSYYLQRTEEIERRKVSLGKPSCSSSSRSIARPRRPQKSIKYVGHCTGQSQSEVVPTSPCSFDKLHISWNVEKRDKINETGQSGRYLLWPISLSLSSASLEASTSPERKQKMIRASSTYH